MSDVRYTSHTAERLAEIQKAIPRALEIVGGTAERYIKEITPVDTGRLRNSIANEPVNNNTMAVGTDVEYAPYVELGTRSQRAQPYIRPGVENHRDEYAKIIKSELEL